MNRARATVTIDADDMPTHTIEGAVAYAVLAETGHLYNASLNTVNPRVWANALQFIIDDLLALADAADIPPLDPQQYPRHLP